ncbi:hypothetical protein [Streptomyces chartreusis]|uniref:hypothetical protein n=1 Tax=Streptomyces chartreusis TaxID=1969 RepID=UPI00142EDDC6|nr:hypothetical protein [Streptomyces chartreusis]
MGRGDQRTLHTALTCGGCLLTVLGSTAATLLWASSDRTRRHLGAGFEGEGTDYVAALTELPLVAAAGALVPALACALALRLTGRRKD